MTFKFKNLNKLFLFLKSRVDVKVDIPSKSLMLLHWKILVIGFFAVTFLALFTSILIYRDVGHSKFFSDEGQSAPQSSFVTKGTFDLVVSNFETKRVNFEQVRKNHAVSIDPSK